LKLDATCLTAAFEEHTGREGRREGYQYREYHSPAHSPASSWSYQGALEGAYRNYGPNQGRVALLLPSIPMQWIVPTLHILLGIINDIVSRYGAFMAEHLEVDTEEVQKLQQLAQDEHYMPRLQQEEGEANL
jgi:hypothetical protein